MVSDVTDKKMVAGFLFSGPKVLLVQKIRPSWQAGLLNGIGGLIEPTETPLRAMQREFAEETSYERNLDWRHFATEVEPFGAYVYFFWAHMPGLATGYAWPSVNDADEPLTWVHCHDLMHMKCLGNLNWLVPLALDWRGLDQAVTVMVKGDIRERASW